MSAFRIMLSCLEVGILPRGRPYWKHRKVKLHYWLITNDYHITQGFV